MFIGDAAARRHRVRGRPQVVRRRDRRDRTAGCAAATPQRWAAGLSHAQPLGWRAGHLDAVAVLACHGARLGMRSWCTSGEQRWALRRRPRIEHATSRAMAVPTPCLLLLRSVERPAFSPPGSSQFAAKGASMQLGPGMCLARVPNDGRNFEYIAGEVHAARVELTISVCPCEFHVRAQPDREIDSSPLTDRTRTWARRWRRRRCAAFSRRAAA